MDYCNVSESRLESKGSACNICNGKTDSIFNNHCRELYNFDEECSWAHSVEYSVANLFSIPATRARVVGELKLSASLMFSQSLFLSLSHFERKYGVKCPLPFCILNVVERHFPLIPFKSSPPLGVLSGNYISFDISPYSHNCFKICLFPNKTY